jgi:hypothetical protein
MVQHKFVRFLVAAVLLLSCAAAVRAQEPKAHRMGEWPALSANILNTQQKNLNLDDRDFVIEVWFKPLDWIKYKTTAPACLVSKKGGAGLAGYDLSYYQDGTISLTVCDKANELLPDSEFHATAALKMDKWNYLAVVAGHKDKKVTFYVDGKKVKECGGFSTGDISNRDNFNITYNEYTPNSQAHCLLSQARVWKLTKDMPAEIDKVMAAHQADAAKVSDELKGAADYSMWTFEAGNDNIKDQGSNGNELVYTPWAFKGEQDTVKVPEKVAGDTYYVDAAKGDDANAGGKDKPFKTLARGARAAMPGDLLHINAGVYRESLRLREGTSDKPVTAEGEPGTVVSGFEPVSGWVKGDGGQWVIKDWTGDYAGPMDAKEDDARKEPGNILFVDGTPMDFVMTRTELAPGTWTIAPILHSEGAKTITVCPLPGVDPTKVPTELSDCRKTALLLTTKFNQVRGIHFTGGGAGVGGVCNLLENCVVDWGGGNGIGYGGRDNIIRNNKIYWFGLTGFGGGGGIRNTFEGNTISYCCWRLFSGSWHGGAIKIIPTVLDFRMRNNEICYNWVAGIWYDTNAQGCVTEGNVVHDNTGSALFDEFCFANTWQDNIAYNNVGPGMCVGNSNEDIVQRNILFNNTGGIYHRTDHIGAKNPPDVRKQQEDEWLPKFDVRRYNGLISYEREKRFRDMSDLYCYDYVGDNNMRNQILENVIIEHSGCIGQAIHYGVPGRVIPKDAENTFDRNYYWTDLPGQKIIVNGPKTDDLKAWQESSGQDKDSRFIDPWENRDQMPEWFKKKFNFKKDEFRPTQATWDKYMATKTRRSISQLVMFSRLLRSKTIEEAKFSDPDISGLYFECEGKRCLALWSANPSVKYFALPEGSEVVRENKFLQRKPLEVLGGKASVYLTEVPMTLLGVDKGLAEDNSLALQPQSKEGDKAVEFRLTLTNTGAGEQAYDLAASVGPGWDVSPAKVQKSVAAGQKEDVTLKITGPKEVSEGVFQLSVAGKVGGADMAASKVFKVGLTRQIPFRTEHIAVDGDMAKWAKFEPSATADKADRVVFGRDQWKGPQDLSAKVWLRWENDQGRDLFFAADVTEDKIVTSHRDDDPTQSDSVELLVDVRAAWKQYMKEYTTGAFKVVLVPADGDKPMTAKFIGPAFGYIVKSASKKTDHGYSVEFQMHFRSNLVETPGWVEGKEVRVGVLVNHSDDPAAKDKKCVLGLWHTVADAQSDCSSLTTMTLKK